MRLLFGLSAPCLLAGLSDGFADGRVEDRSEGFAEALAEGFGAGLNLRFSSSSWNFLPISFAVLWDLEWESFFLMNFEKSPCFLGFPPGIRGLSESFINF
jgi:hypothetical protein